MLKAITIIRLIHAKNNYAWLQKSHCEMALIFAVFIFISLLNCYP